MKKLSLNGFELSSKMTIGLVCLLAACMHFTFLMMFLKFGLMPFMYFNIGSVTFYIIGFIISVCRDITKHVLAWITMIYVEVVAHAVLCTLFQGVDTCFILYPLITLPVCVYFLFFYTDRRVFVRSVIVFTSATFIVTGITVAVSEFSGGTVPSEIAVLSRNEKTALRCVNISFSAVMLYGFTMMFYLEMNKLLDRLRKSTDKLQYTATHDALTGLTNRRSFWEYFDAICNDGKHYNIAMGDLDSFKRINDTYGHGCGDLVLKSVADVINSNTEENEIACRWGGEEMVVVFMGERPEALERLEKIRAQIEALALEYEGLKVKVTMTFGFADSAEIARALEESDAGKSEAVTKRSDMEALISMADKRLYTGKGGGKNVVVDK